MCRSAQFSTLSLWSRRPTTVRTKGVCAHESVVVVRAFLIGCVLLLIVVGCSGTRSGSPKQQGHTEATREQTRSAKAASEQARCAETQLIDHHRPSVIPSPGRSDEDWVTNNVPGCPKGGSLLGTDSTDKLDGGDGDDEIRGLGAKDALIGGNGSDVIYGGPGNDSLTGIIWDVGLNLREKGKTGQGMERATSKDVLYGGPGDDEQLWAGKGDDMLYGGPGNDEELYDGAGDDVIYGGDGDDEFYMGGGEDVFYGGDGNDVLYIESFDGQR